MTAQLTGVTDDPTGTEPVAPAKPGRITSLDWIRGLFLCCSVATNAVLPPRPDALQHAAWFGVTAQDLIFPLFVTLSGCGLAFAYRNRVGWAATIRRSVVLLACGLAYNAVVASTLGLGVLRWTGALQTYAVLVLVIGLLHLVARSPRAWLLITALATTAHALLLLAWQSSCPGHVLTPACNPSLAIDHALFGTAHMYASGELGHDPEGVVAVMGALVTACVGATAGHLALATRGTRRGPLYLGAWAVVALGAAFVVAQYLPAMKRLWTTPFALGAGVLGVVALAVGMAILDLPARNWWGRIRERVAWPQIAMGRNSLLIYFGSHLLMFWLATHGGEYSYAEQIAATVEVWGHPRASLVVAAVLAWALLAALLHKFRIYLRP